MLKQFNKKTYKKKSTGDGGGHWGRWESIINYFKVESTINDSDRSTMFCLILCSLLLVCLNIYSKNTYF